MYRDTLQCRLAALSNAHNHPNDDPPWTDETNDEMKYMIWRVPIITHAYMEINPAAAYDLSFYKHWLFTGSMQVMHNGYQLYPIFFSQCHYNNKVSCFSIDTRLDLIRSQQLVSMKFKGQSDTPWHNMYTVTCINFTSQANMNTDLATS